MYEAGVDSGADSLTSMNAAVWFALSVTAAAGAATALGAGLALGRRRMSRGFLALALGFSAGVMMYVSFIEIVPKSLDLMRPEYGDGIGAGVMSLALLGGLIGMAVLYRLIPELHHPALDQSHTSVSLDQDAATYYTDPLLLRAGIGVALAITLHNLPEGMATFFLTLTDPQVGVPIAVAIAIHNIPEGIAVAVPIYYATRSRRVAFGFGALAAIAEPLGAVLGYAFLQPFITDTLLGVVFAAVAGIMVYISVDGLLPAARQYGSGQLALYGLIAGMGVMALSIVLFRL